MWLCGDRLYLSSPVNTIYSFLKINLVISNRSLDIVVLSCTASMVVVHFLTFQSLLQTNISLSGAWKMSPTARSGDLLQLHAICCDSLRFVAILTLANYHEASCRHCEEVTFEPCPSAASLIPACQVHEWIRNRQV